MLSISGLAANYFQLIPDPCTNGFIQQDIALLKKDSSNEILIRYFNVLTTSQPDIFKKLSIKPDYHVILIHLPSMLIYIYIHFKTIFNTHFSSNIALLSTRRLYSL